MVEKLLATASHRGVAMVAAIGVNDAARWLLTDWALRWVRSTDVATQATDVCAEPVRMLLRW